MYVIYILLSMSIFIRLWNFIKWNHIFNGVIMPWNRDAHEIGHLYSVGSNSGSQCTRGHWKW